MSRHDTLRDLSNAVVDVAKDIKILTAISWPQDSAERFLESWRRGSPIPPVREESPRADSRDAELFEIERRCDPGDPAARHIAATAHNYRLAISLISNAGTPEFHKTSRELYGGADGLLPGSTMCHREAAERLLESTALLAEATRLDEHDYCIPAYTVVADLEAEWKDFFDTPMEYVIDPSLASKAAASGKRVRIRGGTCFSKQDISQLSAHEIGVHALTARNGRAQPILNVLGLSAPRTTATQEGLATFAELVTGAIDLARLRRLAIRIRAIAMAEDGADFIQVFEHLVEVGETPAEAVHTAMRVFRGGDVSGRFVFTKDVVYLKGLFSVHTFLRKAIAEHRPELVTRLFCGRLSLGDLLALDDEFEDLITTPIRLPSWAANLPALAGFLAFSALVDRVNLDEVALEDH